MGARASLPNSTRKHPQTSPSALKSPESRRTRGVKGDQPNQRRIVVVVLGDVGRSPRMQYHAASLASHGVRVSLVGYEGERCISVIENDPRITCHRFMPPLSGPGARRLKRRVYIIFAIVKAFALTVRLLYELMFRVPLPNAIMVQNPPSLPSLACVFLACRLRGCPMILDWHNLGFTMFGRGPWHPLVWITRRAEGFFGRRARLNLAVSKAMKHWTEKHLGLAESNVVYDQPPQHFRTAKLPERHALFKKLMKTAPEFSKAALAHTACLPSRDTADGNSDSAVPYAEVPVAVSSSSEIVPRESTTVLDHDNLGSGSEPWHEEHTPFTSRSADGIYSIRKDRPALLVSSTSWTPDEDFSVLLDALVRFDSRATSGAAPGVPFVVVVITGKGPEKARYVERMRATRLLRVALCTAWLEPEDYPLLLGSADLGVSLHTSTSGVDLPMKVVDMFGCGVPVCAMHFECLHELVQQGFNGTVFKNSTELALQLEALLDGFPRASCELQGFRGNVRRVKRWKQNWDDEAWPLIAQVLSQPRRHIFPWDWRPSEALKSTWPRRTWVLSLAALVILAGVTLLIFLGLPWVPRMWRASEAGGVKARTDRQDEWMLLL